MAFCYQRRARLYLTLNRYPVLLVSGRSVTEIMHLSRPRGTTGNLCRAGTVARNRVSLQKGCARLCGGRTCPVQAVDRERGARAAPLTPRPFPPHLAKPWTVEGVHEQPPSHVTSALPMSFQLVR